MSVCARNSCACEQDDAAQRAEHRRQPPHPAVRLVYEFAAGPGDREHGVGRDEPGGVQKVAGFPTRRGPPAYPPPSSPSPLHVSADNPRRPGALHPTEVVAALGGLRVRTDLVQRGQGFLPGVGQRV